MSGEWVVRNRRRARTGRATSNIGEIAANLRRRRNPRLPNLATALAVPLFRPEEEDFVLLDRTTDGVAEVVAAQKVLLSAHRIAGDAADFLLAEEKVFGIEDRKSTRLNSSHVAMSYAVFCLKKKKRRRVGPSDSTA